MQHFKEFLKYLKQHLVDWCRWSLGFTLAILGVSVLAIDIDSKELLALLPVSLVAVAIATLDLDEKPRSKPFLKATGIFLSAILAVSTLRTDAGKDIHTLIMVLANFISISGMIFGIIMILATSWPLFKSRLGRSKRFDRCNSA